MSKTLVDPEWANQTRERLGAILRLAHEPPTRWYLIGQNETEPKCFSQEISISFCVSIFLWRSIRVNCSIIVTFPFFLDSPIGFCSIEKKKRVRVPPRFHASEIAEKRKRV